MLNPQIDPPFSAYAHFETINFLYLMKPSFHIYKRFSGELGSASKE